LGRGVGSVRIAIVKAIASRLEVAVHDAHAVCFGESVRELDRDLEHLAGRQRPRMQARSQRLAPHVLHDRGSRRHDCSLEKWREIARKPTRPGKS
jgi:hypothetical protein